MYRTSMTIKKFFYWRWPKNSTKAKIFGLRVFERVKE